VFTVDVAALSLVDHLPDPFRPEFQTLLVVGASPQAYVPKVCGVPTFRRPFVRVGGNPGDVEALEHRLDSRVAPRIVTELDRPPSTWRQLFEKTSEPVVVTDQVRR
jgi:hypothetical protein